MESLFTLGDRPEERYPVARAWLEERGYASTLDYLRAVAIRVIEETGLLPHLNPGVMSWEEMARLKNVSASMGLMLESSSSRLTEPGGPHHDSPDKDPAVRLRTIEDAGRLSIPFTTGILVGIGETETERADSLLALRELHRRYRHVQEVIVQNFRAKPGTVMRSAPEPEEEEFLATVATARIVFGPRMSVQAPPNLSDPEQQLRLLDAGINDWGGVSPVTPDHVNPERPWPAIERLAETTAARGLELRERLTIYPQYALQPDPWIAGTMRGAVAALATEEGLVEAGASPRPIGWQHQEVRWKSRTTELNFSKGPERSQVTLRACLEDGSGAHRNDQEARLRPRLRLHRGRGRQGILLPPQRPRLLDELRLPRRRRGRRVRDRDQPEGPAGLQGPPGLAERSQGGAGPRPPTQAQAASRARANSTR